MKIARSAKSWLINIGIAVGVIIVLAGFGTNVNWVTAASITTPVPEFPTPAPPARTGSVYIEVRLPDGKPAAEASVRLVEVGGSVTMDETTDENGQFTSHKVPVGEYKATVETKGFEPRTTELHVKTDRAVTWKVQLEK